MKRTVFCLLYLIWLFSFEGISSQELTSSEVKPFFEKKKERIENFFQSHAFFGRKTDPLILSRLIKSAPTPYAIPLDGQFEKEGIFSQFKERPYSFLVVSKTAFPTFTIQVGDEGTLIHEEVVAIPNKNSKGWNHLLIEEGGLYVPETKLAEQYDLDIRIKPLSDHEFLVTLNSHSQSGYLYKFFVDEKLIYAVDCIPSPPWQLENICKPSSQKHLSRLPTATSNPISRPNFKSSNPTINLGDRDYPILNNLVKELKRDPLAIAQYVQNEIDLVDPFLIRSMENDVLVYTAAPILRNELLTYLDKEAGAWEQCSLLVYLLRKAGFEAGYGKGRCTLDKLEVEGLLSTEIAEQVEEVQLDYPFVLLKDGNRWISLFPWLKHAKVEEGYDLYGLLPAEYASAKRWIYHYLQEDKNIVKHIGLDKNDTAGVLFVRYVEEQLAKQGLSLEDVGLHRSVIKHHFSGWEQFPRPLTSQFDTFKEPNLDQYAHLKIAYGPSNSSFNFFEQQYPLYQYIGTSIGLELFNEGGKNKLRYFPIDGRTQKKASYLNHTLSESDPCAKLEVTFISGNFQEKKVFYVEQGTKVTLCFSLGTSSEDTTTFFAEDYLDRKDDQGSLESLLAFSGARYFEKCGLAQKTLAKLHKVHNPIYLNVGLSKVTKRKGGEGDLYFPQVDMQFSYFPFQLVDNGSWKTRPHLWDDFLALCITDLSSNEHQVIQDVFQDPHAISTVKLLQLANRLHKKQGGSGAGFLSLTRESYSAIENDPSEAKNVYFPHLKDLDLVYLKGKEKSQWTRAGELLTQDEFTTVFMTPGQISSEDDVAHPSYKGAGTLILNPHDSSALISGFSSIMNGGFGRSITQKTFDDLLKNRGNNIPSPNYIVSAPLDSLYFEKIFSPSKSTNPSTPNIKIGPISIGSLFQTDIRGLYRDRNGLIADPVDVITGAFYIDEVDLSIPGHFPLQVRRNYSNQNTNETVLGFGWKFSLNPYLFEEDDKLFIAEEDGTLLTYRRKNNTNQWIILAEDNPGLNNYNLRGVGSLANPFHAYVEKQGDVYIHHGTDGSQRTFVGHLLKTWTNSSGHKLFFTYSGQALTRIENEEGYYVGFKYNYTGKIAEAYSQDGHRIHYKYNTLGDLTEVVLPNDCIIAYKYDEYHQITRETKPYGQVLENSYDSNGRVIEQRSPLGPLQALAPSAQFRYENNATYATDAIGATTEYCIYDNKIYKITDPLGYVTLQSWFLDDHSYFDANLGSIVLFDRLGGYQRSLKSKQDKRGLITEYRYDLNGNPTEISLIGEDLTGKGDQKIGKELEYNKNNLPIKEKAHDRVTLTSYDETFEYLPKKIETWINQKPCTYSEFTYDKRGQLINQDTDRVVLKWEYEKGFPVKLTQKTGTNDPDVVTLYKYNNQGQITSKISQDGSESYQYDVMGNLLRSSQHNLSGQPLATTYTEYNLNGQPVVQQGADPNNFLYLDYNANGKLKASRQSLTNFNGSMVVPAGFAYRLYDYDTRGHLIEEVNPVGISIYREYDPLGRVSKETCDQSSTLYEYEAGGFVASITGASGARTTRLYTTNGLLKKEIYPDGTESSFIYDFFGRPILETRIGKTWEITYNDIFNQVTRVQRESGIKETRTFDSRGNLLTYTDPEGYTWLKTYDLVNRIISEADPEGHITNWSYQNDKVICTLPNRETTTQRFECGQSIETTTTDSEGHVLFHSITHFCPEIGKTDEIHGNLITTSWTNTQGQPLCVKRGDVTTIYQYDDAGRCIAITDGDGRTTKQAFDRLGRVSKKILPDGAEIKFDYDTDSNIIAYILPDNLTWEATYDHMGRKTAEWLKSSAQVTQQWEYTYENGLLQSTEDPLGRTYTYIYDAADRLINEQVVNSSRLFSYDNRGLLTSAEQKDQDHSLVKRSYNATGNLILEEIFLDGQLLQQSQQTWNPSGRSLKIGHHQRDFEYQVGRLSSLSCDNLKFSYEYDEGGLLIRQASPFSLTAYSYSPSGLPETRITQLLNESHSETLSWTPAGLLAAHHSNRFEDKQYSYTERAYLRSVNNQRYTFDYGKRGKGIRTSAPNHQIEPTGLDPFGQVVSEKVNGRTIHTSYNFAGQTILRKTLEGDEHFEWNPWGNLISVSTPSTAWQASYDALGRRIQTSYALKPSPSSPLNKVTSLFDPEHEFQEIGVKLNNMTFWKLYGSSLDAITNDEGETLSLFHDALGNLSAVISKDEIHWIEELPSPYGPTGPPPALEPTLLPFAKSHTWQGNRQDDTGLIHLGARYYNPLTGRFLSPDPIGYPVPLNLYAYANGDPINFKDPSGRFRSPSYEPIGSTALDILGNPYLHGSLRMRGGYAEAMIGAGIIAGGIATGGVGLVVGGVAGGFLMFNGIDNFAAGAEQIYTGEYRDSLVSQYFQSKGFSGAEANTAEWVLSLGSSNSAFASKAGQNLASNASKVINGNSFKPFTKDNYRDNLKRLTGMNPETSIDAHHVFPQQLRDIFKGKGINVDDPRYCTWWERSLHRQAAKEYNKEWRIFLRDNPEVTQSQVLEKGRQLMQKYGMDVHY